MGGCSHSHSPDVRFHAHGSTPTSRIRNVAARRYDLSSRAPSNRGASTHPSLNAPPLPRPGERAQSHVEPGGSPSKHRIACGLHAFIGREKKPPPAKREGLMYGVNSQSKDSVIRNGNDTPWP